MSRPKLLPPLAPETLAALERINPGKGKLAPRHEVNAEVDSRLLEIVRSVSISERHLREMDAGNKAGEVITWGALEGKPTGGAARWAKRCLDALTEVCRVATEAGDAAFPLHMEAIRRGRENPPMPLRWQVWMAWKWASLAKRPPMSDDEIWEMLEDGRGFAARDPYVPTAGEVAAAVGDSDKMAEITVRDCTNHLKALGLPYAPARRGKRKSI
jgi:hypothetical protein